MRALYANALANKQLLHTCGRARQETRVAGSQKAQALRSETVYIFQGANRLDDGSLVNLRWQGKLHQDSVHSRICIELVDQIEESCLDGIGRQFVKPAFQTGLFTGFALLADIDLAGRILADKYSRQSRTQGMLPCKEGRGSR